jgi:hypothetical protein
MVFVPFVNVPPSVAEKVTVFPSITAEASDCELLALSTSSYSRLTPANVDVMVLIVLVITRPPCALGVTVFESIRAPSRRVELGQYLHELDQQNTVALLVVAPRDVMLAQQKIPEPASFGPQKRKYIVSLAAFWQLLPLLGQRN